MEGLTNNADDRFISAGFKCGLEIHQQLLTEKKLFCRCPAQYRNDQPDAEIIRHMRPTLSELGEYDGTALMEFKTKKNVIYQLYRDNCCTYEMDDTPPFEINRQALQIALKLAMLLNCQLVDEIHVSRKQYLDGSIPTGFQRTAIVGVNGWVPYRGRKITITHVCLEEDACREISDIGHYITFRTDRLSFPLLEVITAPDMRTPREAQEVDALIGRVLKASGLVRRGIGSVRQDVNVSIEGGARAEIKGVPQTQMIERLTAIEAHRQAALLELRQALRHRGITDKTIHGEKFDLTEILAGSALPVVEKAMRQGWAIRAIKIDGFAGLLSWPLQPGKTFADELAGRVRVIACLDQMPNIAVSDLPEMAGFNQDIWRIIKRYCDCKPTDAVVVCWGPPADVTTALAEIKIRAIEATIGVPRETRQAMPSGTTDFERILPGPDRMYPDTDAPPVEVAANWVKQLKTELPMPAYETEKRLIKAGVPEAIACKVVVSAVFTPFWEAVTKLGIPPTIAWAALAKLDRRLKGTAELVDGSLMPIFRAYKDGRISKHALFDIFDNLAAGIDDSIDDLIASRQVLRSDSPEFASALEGAIAQCRSQNFKSERQRLEFVWGRLRERFGVRLCEKETYHLVKARLVSTKGN